MWDVTVQSQAVGLFLLQWCWLYSSLLKDCYATSFSLQSSEFWAHGPLLLHFYSRHHKKNFTVEVHMALNRLFIQWTQLHAYKLPTHFRRRALIKVSCGAACLDVPLSMQYQPLSRWWLSFKWWDSNQQPFGYWLTPTLHLNLRGILQYPVLSQRTAVYSLFF